MQRWIVAGVAIGGMEPLASAQMLELLSFPAPGDGPVEVGSDLTGDGRRELWIGLPAGHPGESGRVQIHSGADGALLHTWRGEFAGDLFGSAIEKLPDLDGDGVEEIAVGAPGLAIDAAHRPYVHVRSGVDGAVLLRLVGPGQASGYGAALQDLGDVDGDGVTDLAVGATPPYVSSALAFAEVRSGATGAHLWQSGFAQSFGEPVALARYPDVDADGASELAIGFSAENRVELRSGATGVVLEQIAAPASSTPGHIAFGAALDSGGDFDGDGLAELLVGAPAEQHSSCGPTYEGCPHHGSVYVLSGAALGGEPAYRVTARPGETGLGWSLAAIGDSSGDGRPDFVTGNQVTRSGCCFYSAGSARVYAGRDGAVILHGWVATNGRYAAAGDWNGDGLMDFVVNRPDSFGSSQYTAAIVAGAHAQPAPDYECLGTTDGCFPAPLTTGEPSASSSEPFGIHAIGFPDDGSTGFLVLGTSTLVEPFGLGRLCIGDVFARFVAERRTTDFPGICPGAFSYELDPGIVGVGPLAPGEVVYAQYLAIGPGGVAEAQTSASLRIEILP